MACDGSWSAHMADRSIGILIRSQNSQDKDDRPPDWPKRKCAHQIRSARATEGAGKYLQDLEFHNTDMTEIMVLLCTWLSLGNSRSQPAL